MEVDEREEMTYQVHGTVRGGRYEVGRPHVTTKWMDARTGARTVMVGRWMPKRRDLPEHAGRRLLAQLAICLRDNALSLATY